MKLLTRSSNQVDTSYNTGKSLVRSHVRIFGISGGILNKIIVERDEFKHAAKRRKTGSRSSIKWHRISKWRTSIRESTSTESRANIR